MLERRGTDIDAVVEFRVSEDELLTRLTGRGRADDTEEVIRNRLANFHFMTEPLAAYYRQRGVLLTINGEQPIPYVFEDIMKKIAKLGFTA